MSGLRQQADILGQRLLAAVCFPHGRRGPSDGTKGSHIRLTHLAHIVVMPLEGRLSCSATANLRTLSGNRRTPSFAQTILNNYMAQQNIVAPSLQPQLAACQLAAPPQGYAARSAVGRC